MKKLVMFFGILVVFFTSCQEDLFVSPDREGVVECIEPPESLKGPDSQWENPQYVRMFQEDIDGARYRGKFGISIVDDYHNPDVVTVINDDVYWINARIDYGIWRGKQYVSFPSIYSISGQMLYKAKDRIKKQGWATAYSCQEYENQNTGAGKTITYTN
jgi:hypothetical protein